MTDREVLIEALESLAEVIDDDPEAFNTAVFLCYLKHTPTTARLLDLFQPPTELYDGCVWWTRHEQKFSPVVNEERMIACCFMLAMLDDV